MAISLRDDVPLHWPSREDYSVRWPLPSKQRVAGSNPAGRAAAADQAKLRSRPRGGLPSMTVTGAAATAVTSILRCYTAGTADNSGSAILPGHRGELAAALLVPLTDLERISSR